MLRHCLVGLVLSAVIATAACGRLARTEPVVGTRLDCDTTRMHPPAGLLCDKAVHAAISKLVPGAQVTVATFRYGTPCPPNARCAPFGDGNTGYVVLELADGRCGYVTVSNQPGGPLATTIRTWPPVEWGSDPGVDVASGCG